MCPACNFAAFRTSVSGIRPQDSADCIADGLPVKGYLYWILLDNFEWQKGFGMTFGLVAVDRVTQEKPVPAGEDAPIEKRFDVKARDRHLA